MTQLQIGIIHPGEMGISIAAAAQHNGPHVYWASAGRSVATHERAARHQLHDVGTVANLCAACSIIISLCPPHAAEKIAEAVLAHNFRGLYLEANAVAPQRVTRLSEALATGGITLVDGCIIGGPAWTPGATHLYLSGPQAEAVAACFINSPLATHVMGPEVGQASALKMCYAAYTKGTTALLSAILATAEQLKVREALNARWSQDEPGFAEQVERRVCQATAKAWRFVGEMEEIAATFREAGLPDEFHLGAAAIYRRLASFRTASEKPPLAEVLAALTE